MNPLSEEQKYSFQKQIESVVKHPVNIGWIGNIPTIQSIDKNLTPEQKHQIASIKAKLKNGHI